MSTPLPSPHPLFGKKPNRLRSWFERKLGDPRDAYWPSVEDIALFKTHMAKVEAWRRDGIGPPPYHPFLSDWTDCPSKEWKARQRVQSVREWYEHEEYRAAERSVWDSL